MESFLDALAENVKAQMAEHDVPGVSVGLLWQGERWTMGYGVTHHEHPLPVTPETLFQIGSITKTVTATAVMRLVEAGQLSLDAPVRTYVPSFAVGVESAGWRR